MYGVHDFGLMLADSIRTRAYEEALRQVIRPGCTVLEIGTGTGLFAMLARRWGAGHVYAVEVLDAVTLAPAIAAANGLDQGVEFIKGLSTDLRLPQQVDVLVSDLRGALPLHAAHIPSIVDARDRLLASGGIQIPLRDVVRAAVVEAPSMHRRLNEPWDTDRFGIDHSIVRDLNVNAWRRWHHSERKDARALTDAATWATLDYATVREPHVMGDLEWTVETAGTAHGLNLWFDATLIPGVEYSTHPDGGDLVYGNAFFPLRSPVELDRGDIVRCSLRADLISGNYVWTWRTCCERRGKQPVRFVQSTFFSVPLAPHDVAVQSAGHAPELAPEGQVLRAALSLMDGTTSVESIAQELESRFPDRFTDQDPAIDWVRQVCRQYSG